MKFSLFFSTLVMVLFSTSSSFAQTNIVERGFACSINDGYSMRDVVEVARNFEWSEDAAPGVVIFRSAVAVAGEFQNDWDFVFASYYPSYADMVEKRGVFLNRSGGRTGVSLSDVATCGDRVRISNMQFATPLEGGSPPEFALAASWICELNGATFADALSMASGGEQALGSNARAAVTRRAFGGPPIQNNSQVEIRMTCPSAADFGAGFDAIQQGTPPANAITCSGGSMWAQYLIHTRNN